MRKAVFPAAGLGTRMLPATKALPKEMLPVVDRPVIQYGVEEAVASGLTHAILVTSARKGAIEDHFDSSPELERLLAAKGDTATLALVEGIAGLAQVSWVRQRARSDSATPSCKPATWWAMSPSPSSCRTTSWRARTGR